MKNDRSLSDIVVSPIFSQLLKERRKKLFKGVQTLSYNKCKFLFLFVLKPKVHALPNNKKT